MSISKQIFFYFKTSITYVRIGRFFMKIQRYYHLGFIFFIKNIFFLYIILLKYDHSSFIF